MAITFATLSRIETRATRNYTDSVKCEKVAKAGLEHAIYELWLDKFGTDTLAYNDDDDGNPGEYGLDENFDSSGTSWPGNSVFPDTGTDNYDNDGDGADDSRWIYFPLTNKAGTSTSAIRLPGNLLARYAVLITDDREARININVTGNKAGGPSHTSNEGWSTFEVDLSGIISQVSGTSTTIASDIIDTRLGSDDAPGTSTPTNDDNGIVPDPQSDNIDNDGDWSVGNDTNGNGIPDSGEIGVDDGDNSESIDEPNEFNSISPYGDDVPFGILAEAEIMGTSSYTSRLETIFNTRGVIESEQNLLKNWITTYSADTIVCPPYPLDSGTSTTMLNINALVNNEGAYDDNEFYYDSDKKVEMIMDALVAGGITGTFGSAGYIERHQLAVNIKDFIDPYGTVTSYNDGTDIYYGVDRTPYINEVEAEVNGATSSGNGKFIELFNPYDIDIRIANWTITFSGPTTITLGTVGTTTVNARDYYVVADNALAYETNFNYEGGGTAADLYDANVNSLATAGEVLTLSDNNGTDVQVTNYGNADTTNTKQLNDPRPIPLTASASDPWEWTMETETAGEENQTNVFNPGDGNDGWSDATWNPSFLVANRRFSNKGYLGFIHRGEEWSSFKVDDNITYPDVLKYITITDPSMDGIDNDGDVGTDTADTGLQAGDIDGKEYRIPGLINVNTAPENVLLSLPNLATIADDIATSINKPFTSIGDLVDDVTQITGSGTKWEKEKTFRSISNLITTRSNVFTVYVTAQITDEAISNVYAEKKIIAIVDRSVDPIKIRYFRWITE